MNRKRNVIFFILIVIIFIILRMNFTIIDHKREMSNSLSVYKDVSDSNGKRNPTADRINLIFNEHKSKDNVVPEKLIEISKNNIAKIYYKQEYKNYEFIVCLDHNDTLNIVYSKDKKYYSMCQILDWTNGDYYVYEHEKGNGITTYKDILGYSGIKIELQNGAASRYIFYIIIDDTPTLLLSSSLSGEFSEFDIDRDGQKELLAFDGYMYIKIDNKLFIATYVYDKTKIKQVFFKDELRKYIVYFDDGTSKEYKYDIKQKCLIELLH